MAPLTFLTWGSGADPTCWAGGSWRSCQPLWQVLPLCHGQGFRAQLPVAGADVSLSAVRLLREELQLLQEQGSYVGEVVRAMDKKKVLVKVRG